MKNCGFILLVFAIFNSCNPSVNKRFCTVDDIQRIADDIPVSYENRPPKDGEGRACCKDPLSYVPDTAYLDHTPMRYIKINFHLMNSADSSQFFDEQKSRKYAKSLIWEAEKRIRNNKQMNLPPRNNTPVVPPRYRYKLTPRPDSPDDDGIYCHYNDELYYYINKGKDRNNHKRDVINDCGIQLDTVLNAFLLPIHPDSLKSKTYKGKDAGIALGNAIKVGGHFLGGRMEPWIAQKYFNHEVGHIFGLNHTWRYNDGCEDTPKNPNCWNNKQSPECDSLYSNNFMDYNAYQNSWSPCQIGKMHRTMSNPKNRKRKMVEPTWCTFREDRHIYIQDSIHWKSMKDLEGHLTIEPGGILKISCRVSFPKGAKIIVKAGGKLILDNCTLHNDCGENWEGIEVQEFKNKRGEILFLGEPKIKNIEHPF
ncbi:MAG: M43 family zinc metalloprotease [Bacteroidetes bacterium]|jgi:hypothetical protein|nr:M43 family zinc metalloprotease [Bacteroidota bacterium]MDF1866554.1 M43 family zinc metalloprotease [Saprospiraceae bacterium]